MNPRAAFIVLLVLMASGADAAAFRDVRLVLPRAAPARVDVALRVHAGRLPPGSEIDVYGEGGALLGTISPFGARRGHEAGTYTIPVRASLVQGRRLTVRLVLTQPGKPPRAPTRGEVREVTTVAR